MRCLYCKRAYSFRNDDGHGIYCSPKCAIDALGSLDYKQYLLKMDVLLQEKVIEFLDSKKYLNAIICAEGCKSLAPDIKGEIGYRCLNFPNAHVDSARGKTILKEAVIEGSLKSAKLFFSYNFSPNLSNSAFTQMVKILLPYIEDMKNEFNKMFNSFDKLKVLEDIGLKFDNQSVIRGKVDSFIQQKRLVLLLEEYELALTKNLKKYELALTRKANAKTAEEFLAAADLFDSLANKNFKDAIEQSSICRNMGLQLKIDFAEQQREKAQSFEDYLGVIELYLELNDFNVENANSWIEFFYLKADSELDKELISLPSTYDDCIREINLLETKGFVYSGQLREKFRGKIEALWSKALLQVFSAKNIDELRRAKRVLAQFITLKTNEAKKMIRIVEDKRTKIEQISDFLLAIVLLLVVASGGIGCIMTAKVGGSILIAAVFCFSVVFICLSAMSSICFKNVLQRIAFKIYPVIWKCCDKH